MPIVLICPCGCRAVFWRFHMGPPAPCLLARPAVPHPSCHYTARLLVMSSFQSSRSSARPTGSHRPSPRHLDTTGGEGLLASPAMPFMSARRGIIRLRFVSRRSSPRLLAPMPITINLGGCLRLSASDCVGSRAYRLVYQSAHPLRSHPPRPIDTGNGENDGATYSRAWCGYPV